MEGLKNIRKPGERREEGENKRRDLKGVSFPRLALCCDFPSSHLKGRVMKYQPCFCYPLSLSVLMQLCTFVSSVYVQRNPTIEYFSLFKIKELAKHTGSLNGINTVPQLIGKGEFGSRQVCFGLLILFEVKYRSESI